LGPNQVFVIQKVPTYGGDGGGGVPASFVQSYATFPLKKHKLKMQVREHHHQYVIHETI